MLPVVVGAADQEMEDMTDSSQSSSEEEEEDSDDDMEDSGRPDAVAIAYKNLKRPDDIHEEAKVSETSLPPPLLIDKISPFQLPPLPIPFSSFHSPL